jgi:hypothetical protein
MRQPPLRSIVVRRIPTQDHQPSIHKEGEVMKRLALLALVAVPAFTSGCQLFNTPALTADERFAQIGRNWTYEYEQIGDDVDHALLLRPEGRMSIWNIVHTD